MSSFNEDDAFEAAVTRPSADPSSGQSLSQLAMQGAMGARAMDYLDGLNPAQRAAVEALDGPVLMLAGAGTGKTKALTARIAHLLNTGRARPNEILAVTFTNKAAREMKERVAGLMGHTIEGMPWLGTFHSVCVKLLRRHAEMVGLKSNFTILDTDDQVRLMKQLIIASGMDEKRWPARQLAGIIDGWKNRALTPKTLPGSEAAAFDDRGPKLYAQYQERLQTLNAVDFGDLLLHMVTIFQTHPDLLEQYQRWFKYILVDEYQDTNVAQYLWLRLLAGGHKNICCVGDDDQSIYGWRGAEVGNILRFEKDFPGAKVVRLEQNYRSTPHILAAASSVIAGNRDRLGKELWTAETEGEKVRLIGHWDGEEEARWVGEEIEAMHGGSRTRLRQFSLDDMAILVRASHQMRAFEDRFLSIGLPYRVIGGPRFYERMEIRDAMAYFRVVISPEDDLAFERIINTPKRGVGDKALQDIQIAARSNGVNLVEGARIAIADGLLKGKAKSGVAGLLADLDRWSGLCAQQIRYPGVADEDAVVEDVSYEPAEISHIELAEMILDESGYTTMWQNDKTPEAPGRLENLKELVKALEQFDNLAGFLEHVALIMDNDSGKDGEKVTIMTLHGAKGLEFPVVFLPGWEEGLFPSQRSMDESGLKGLEEERRLAYVGITRAEELCTITFAANRRVYGQWQSQLASRFIDELPVDHVDVMTPSGLSNTPGGFGSMGGHRDDDLPRASFHDRVSNADAYESPGWRRMQNRTHQAKAGQRGVSQSIGKHPTVIDAKAVVAFAIGDRVFHKKFGYGEVMEIEGDKLAIEFDHSGLKKLVAGFVLPAEKASDVPF
ncbi:MAG: UvrD-helicase domain-containing protein [Alphaproteobacteria bacterium]|nr:UvrD-helicase domain-containing protein [Alphaproteobacteria bacterium]MBU1573592.1 UvrD-helicase domain-containing protein [Alphaproteobacteria bacterium]MBU2078894.1 UvrD-helicase domain-containing protein [Alphaproteobacteria bacterium]MBU2160061.1 UvrD-helicase domain-containing protein [Alphaproteobacteria bacterium]